MAGLSDWASLTSAMPAAELPSPRRTTALGDHVFAGCDGAFAEKQCQRNVGDGGLKKRGQLPAYDMWSRTQRFYGDN